MKISGILIGIIELILFYFFSRSLREKHLNLNKMDTLSYYWMMMTILTCIWELSYILNHKKIIKISNKFLKDKKNVWTSKFNLFYIIPWRLSEIFYAEYGAYADREYMTNKDIWSRVVEGTHALFCGVFSLLSIISINYNLYYHYYIMATISMSTQLMNSLLYMSEYYIQIKNKYSVNYNSVHFPCGVALLKRPFMYVNILWTLFPTYVILKFIVSV